MNAIEFIELFNNSGVESNILVPAFKSIEPTAKKYGCSNCDCECVNECDDWDPSDCE